MNMKAFIAIGSLCAGLVLGASSAPAWAADQTPATDQPGQSSQPGQPGAAPPTTKKTPPVSSSSEGAVSEVVVTGSRIKSTNFNSADPLTVITSEQAQLTGSVDVGQILQLTAVAANSTQINNYFSAFINTGGPGVNTLSLFGLGAQRTLFLVNGERLGPAGVGGTVGPFDLNVIPESMIDHTEILKDGASSIYGSDAVAGVVNFITKTNQDGGDITATVNPSQYGGGNVYDINGSFGKTFDKGYIQAGVDVYQQTALTYGQRGYFNCSQDLVTYPGGGSADISEGGHSKCWNVLTNMVVDEGVYNGFVEYAPSSSAVLGGGSGLDLPGFHATGVPYCGTPAVLCALGANGLPSGTINVAATRASLAEVPDNASLYERSDAISPVNRYSLFLFGGYDLTPTTHIYASVILNQRDSQQNGIGQFFGVANPASPQNPGFAYPLPIVLQNLQGTQTVDYARFVLGVKGDIPNLFTLTNWTYDVYGQYSRSSGTYTQQYIPLDRASAVFGAANAEGCDPTSTWEGGESMAQLEPGVSCVPFNLYKAVADGGLNAAEQAFLYKNEVGHTTYDYGYVEGSATGDLFQLPAGPLGAAIGFHVRHEGLDDTPGADFIDGNVYNYTTEGITKGTVNIGEIFGELKIPILKGLPFIYGLDADISGRFSDYSSYGTNTTYKGTLDWKVTDWFAARATYGTAFRAPALYEEFLANQTGYYPQLGVDPCINYGTSGVSAQIQKNCASLGIGPAYNGQGSYLLSPSGGGGASLQPETAITATYGVLLTPNWWGQRINLSVDWYDFDISNEIDQFGVSNIAFACYNSTDFGPSNPFCKAITRAGAAGGNGYNPYEIEEILNPYINISRTVEQGIDINLNWKTDLPKEVKLTTTMELNWTLYNTTVLDGFVVNDYLGQNGNPRFDGNIDWEFDRGQWTFNWLLYMIGHSSDNPFTSTTITNYRGTGQTVDAQYEIPFYTESTVSIRRKFDKFTISAGVKNLFNQGPPATSFDDANEGDERYGDTAIASQYDFIGRSFFAQIDAKF